MAFAQKLEISREKYSSHEPIAFSIYVIHFYNLIFISKFGKCQQRL